VDLPPDANAPAADGSLDVALGPPGPVVDEAAVKDHYVNLADHLGDRLLGDIANTTIEAVKVDLESRSDWDALIVRGIEELGLKIEDVSEPFQGACNATHPLLIENIVKFQAKAIHELVPETGPARTRIWGTVNEEKEKRSRRMQEYLNYTAMERMSEYYDETERMLFAVPLMGSGFKKTYYDTGLSRPVSEFVSAEQFVVSFNAPDLRRAERYTHILYRTKEQFESDVASGVYRDIVKSDPSIPELHEITEKINEMRGTAMPSDWKAYTIYEHHCSLKLDVDKAPIALPYIVTVDKDSRKVLSIRRNWRKKDPKKRKIVWFSHYKYVPGLGFYGLGLTHLIGSLAATATDTMRSLVDSGSFANLQGGFKARNLRVTGGDDPIAPGEWRDVEAGGMDITKSLVPLPYKEPSQTLLTLHDRVVAAGQKFADTTEQIISDSSNYGPVGTTLALLEASTKFFSAVHKRLHSAQKHELRLLAQLIADYEEGQQYPYFITDNSPETFAGDFRDDMNLCPASDPNTPSNAHRIARNQMALQMAQQYPQFFNARELLKATLIDAGLDELDKLMPDPQQAQPQDPLSDITAASQGQPIKAFPGQDHDAHIQAKMAFLQDPGGGGSPIMQPYAPILATNIREHMMLKLVETAQASGLSPEQAAVQATQMVAQQNVQQMQAAQQQAPQDPGIALGMAELQQRNKEHEESKPVEAAKLMLKAKELELKGAQQKLDALLKGVQIQGDAKAKNRALGVKLTGDLIKAVATQAKGKGAKDAE